MKVNQPENEQQQIQTLQPQTQSSVPVHEQTSEQQESEGMDVDPRVQQWQTAHQQTERAQQGQSQQDAADNSAQIEKLNAFQALADRSPQIQRLAEFQQTADAYTSAEQERRFSPTVSTEEEEPMVETDDEQLLEPPLEMDSGGSTPPSDGVTPPPVEGVDGTPGGTPPVDAPTPSPLPSSESDPDFQKTIAAISQEGDKEQQHPTGEQETQEAKDAAPEAPSYKQGQAQTEQIGTMDGAPTPGFNAAGFVQALMDRIESIMPETEKEADEFQSSGKIQQAKTAVTGTVSYAKEQSIAPLEQATEQTPNTGAIPSKEVTPLPAQPIGRGPKDIEADKAMPKPVDEDRIEQPLQQQSTQLDEQLATNEMTEAQLSTSNQPEFLAALEAKKGAQKDSQDKVQALRTKEQQGNDQAQSEAKGEGDEAMTAMHQDRIGILNQVQNQQQNTSTSYSTEEQKVATQINGIYQTTKTAVEGILNRLDTKVQALFDQGAAAAQRKFESHVNQQLEAYKEKRYAGLGGKLSWIGDAFTGLPDEVNAFFVEGRNLYVEHMRQVIEQIAQYVAQQLQAAKDRVQRGRQAVADYVESLPSHLQKVGQKAAAEINAQFDALDEQVDAKQGDLVDSLAQKYQETLTRLDNHIETMKAANQGLIDSALASMQGVVETIQEIKALLSQTVNAAVDAIKAILADPIGFLSNLINGVSQGFTNFMAKAKEYVTTGFVDWLTGTMTQAGIQLPEDIFSLEGIFDLTTQVLGLTWDFVRERAVKLLGERQVKAAEESFELFGVIREKGIGGAWEELKEQFGDLQETVMGSITGMIVSEVVEAGIKWVLGLLTPAGAFVKAAMLIVDIAKFFIQQGAQVMELVKAFAESISAIASGAVGAVAAKIEEALKLSVPILIGFFAALLGIGDLAGKVQKIFRKVTDRITKAIDELIERAGAWFKDKKGRRKAKRDKKKDKRNEKEQQADLNKGMTQGTAIVNNENLTKEQIEVDLNQLELQLRLKELDAKLIKETEEWHTFMLEGTIGKLRKTKEIRRKPTRAESEEQVSEEDRKLHQQIGGEVKAKMEAKGKANVESFEAFYQALALEAKTLAKTYQPQLRKGIKIDVDLVNRVEQDKKDGDVDVKVRIAPNTFEDQFGVDGNKNLPPTNVTFEEEEGKAGTVTAAPLTKIAGNTTGSTPNAKPLGWNIAHHLNKAKKKEERASTGRRRRVLEWNRVHLLASRLHGPGDKTWNLTPTVEIANGQLRSLENKVYTDIMNDEKYLLYETVVSYGHPNNVQSNDQIEGGEWNTNQFPSEIKVYTQKEGENGRSLKCKISNLPHPPLEDNAIAINYFARFKERIDNFFMVENIEDYTWTRYSKNLRLQDIKNSEERLEVTDQLKKYFLEKSVPYDDEDKALLQTLKERIDDDIKATPSEDRLTWAGYNDRFLRLHRRVSDKRKRARFREDLEDYYNSKK